MSAGIKYQIEYAIAANEKNAKSLKALLDLFSKLEPEGWTPGIYAQCVKELYRVQMCVVHRSLIRDLFRMAEQVDIESLPDLRSCGDDDEAAFTKDDFVRVKDALDSALAGIPPT